MSEVSILGSNGVCDTLLYPVADVHDCISSKILRIFDKNRNCISKCVIF